MIVPHVVVVGKALPPMFLVVIGFQLLIHVKGQNSKALSPIVVTLVGIVTDVSDVHDSKA